VCHPDEAADDSLSRKALAVGAALALILAVIANLLQPPIWPIYIALVAIIAVASFIATEEDRLDRGLPRRRRGAGHSSRA